MGEELVKMADWLPNGWEMETKIDEDDTKQQLVKMADWLPKGWEMETKTDEDGTKQQYFINKSTGQIIHSAAYMVRLATYVNNVEPYLEKFRNTYMDPEKIVYVDRPLDSDALPALNMCVQSLVAQAKNAAAGGGNSYASVTEMPREVIKQEVVAPACNFGKVKKKKRKARVDLR